MWDWRQLKWLYYVGWWPSHAKTRRGYMCSRIGGVLLYISNLIQLVPELIGIVKGLQEGSIRLFLLNVKQSLMGIQWAIKTAILYRNETKIKWIVAKFKDLDGRGREILAEKEMENLTKFRDFRCYLTSVIVPLFLACASLWFIRPLVCLFLGYKVNALDSWTIIDTTSTKGWIAHFILQLIHVYSAVFGLMSFDSFVYCMLETLHLEFDVLKTILSGLTFKTPKNHLKFCVKFHQDILKLGAEINNIINGILLFQTIVVTMVLCLAVFEFSNKDTTILMKVNTVILSACVVYETLAICWFCEELEEQNVKVIRAAYDSQWYNASVQDRKRIVLLMLRSQKEMTFGLIISTNLNVFIGVMKSAFSYYQFLDTMIR